MLCNLLWSYRNEGFKIFAQSRFLLRHGEHTWMQILSYYFVSTLLFFDLPCLDSTNYRFRLRHSLFYWLIQVTIHPSFHPTTYPSIHLSTHPSFHPSIHPLYLVVIYDDKHSKDLLCIRPLVSPMEVHLHIHWFCHSFRIYRRRTYLPSQDKWANI